MKLVVIGMGQCGGRIADEFARLNRRAKSQRGIEAIVGCFAVNTDAADLSGLTAIKPDYQHRILIGGRKTHGHGVGKINELGAEIAKEDGDKVIDAIRTTKRFYEADAFLLIASSGGGTGSGALPVLTQMVKERYMDKPIYTQIILPFEHEETTEERSIYNTALCLKSTSSMSDAVILVDNQRFIRKDSSLRNNLSKINQLIVDPWYNLLCAGEEKKPKYIGAKTVDAGDIIQTMKGWTALGYGRTDVQMFSTPFRRKKSDFRTKGTETHKGNEAMDEALSELSIGCNPADASSALYILSAPFKEMNMSLVKELGDYLRSVAPRATIRNGDYPREKTAMEVTLLLSGLGDVEKIREYYVKSTNLITEFADRKKEIQDRLQDLDETGKHIPSLLE